MVVIAFLQVQKLPEGSMADCGGASNGPASSVVRRATALSTKCPLLIATKSGCCQSTQAPLLGTSSYQSV